ncbi:MAG: dTDP-4-dehydrorhamnose reductase [Burkholderiaceae bacterium]|nr:dTDP-4-dehydrorhamnose reductase [Burkholderiaceae bacterium]
MRLLLLGPDGQIGWEVSRSLQPLGHVMACDRSMADLSRPESLEAVVESVAPHVIVNAAAYTAVDRAEKDRAQAIAVNAGAPGALARAARRAGALLVHYSTDYVFDGSGNTPRNERAGTSPLNVYGQSKLDGERAVARAACDWLVLRTSWVYGARGANFLRTMLRLGAEREQLRVVSDQVGAPTSARLIADSTAQIIHQAQHERAAGRFESEVLHLCAGGETSWHGFAQAIFDGWRRRRGAEALKVRDVVAIPTSGYPTPAARPLNSRLDCARVCERYGMFLPDWRVGVELVLDEVSGIRRTIPS